MLAVEAAQGITGTLATQCNVPRILHGVHWMGRAAGWGQQQQKLFGSGGLARRVKALASHHSELKQT
jgi:hypothetical protein